MRAIHRPFVIKESEDGKRKFIWLGLDESDAEKGILTNQYLLVDGDEGILLDPGGYFVFQRLLRNVAEYIEPSKVKAIFYSHQDPDIIGSLSLMSEFFPNAKIYISKLWTRFLPHLGVIAGLKLVEIPDEGIDIPFIRRNLKAIPAHFLHSPGNFTLYDPELKVLFTSDIGASVFPEGVWYLIVEDFEKHVEYMEGFHRRYLASKKAIDLWVSKIKELEIEVIAPQHGAIFEKENVKLFIEWLSNLDKVGLDLM